MGIIFAFLSPAIFGINNYIDKFLLEKNNISPTVITIYGGLFAFVAGLIILILDGFYPINLKSLMIILASGFLTTIYLLPYYKALSIDETSYVVPLYQFYPIFVLLLSLLIFKDSFSFVQYLGAFTIVLGGFLLSIEEISGNIFKLRKSLYYMLLSCLLFASAQVLYKFGIQDIPFFSSLPYEGFGIAIGALSVAMYKGNLKRFKKETKRFKKKVFLYMTINEIFYLGARYTGYFAISMISVGVVSIIAGLQPFFVLIYGIIISLWFPKILKEVINKKILFQKVISIVLMFVGFLFLFS